MTRRCKKEKCRRFKLKLRICHSSLESGTIVRVDGDHEEDQRMEHDLKSVFFFWGDAKGESFKEVLTFAKLGFVS